MCNSLFDGKMVYETPRQLSKLVGLDGLVWLAQSPFVNLPADKDWRDLDLCLCAIDVRASLAKVGLRCEQISPDPMELTVVR